MNERKSSVEAPTQRFHPDPQVKLFAERPEAKCPECDGENGHNIGCMRAKRPLPYNFTDYPLTGYRHTEPKQGKRPSDPDLSPTSPRPWKPSPTDGMSASHGPPEERHEYTLAASASHGPR